jgi:transposase
MTQTNSPAKDWLEGRRFRAWELKEEGWKQCDIATALGVSEGAVSQWMRRARDGGSDALRSVSPPGAPSRLKPWHQLALLEMLTLGAEAFGFRGAVWTGRRVTALIRQYLGIGYHPGHVTRFLKRWGFTLQKPSRQARQRDEEVIARWQQETWPALKKKRKLKSERSSA